MTTFLGTYDPMTTDIIVDGEEITGFGSKLFSLSYSDVQTVEFYLQILSPSLDKINKNSRHVTIQYEGYGGWNKVFLTLKANSMKKFISWNGDEVGEIVYQFIVEDIH